MVNEAAYLPPEIIEKILSILPVKSLLRFKGVCKSWTALISSHPFIHTHLLHSTSSSSHSLFIQERSINNETSFVVRFQDAEFHVAATPQRSKLTTILSGCNGVLLLLGPSVIEIIELLLWNPSMRKITTLHFPFRLYGRCHYALCYDPAAPDLKVVVVYGHDIYAVYSCKKESWSKHETLNNWRYTRDTVCVDGAAYWICRRLSGVCEVGCFESEGDELKIVQKPSELKERDEFCLIGLRGRVCVWFCSVGESVVRVWMREEEGDGWRDFMRIEDINPHSFDLFRRPYYVGENEIGVYLKGKGKIMVYHSCERRYEEFDCPSLPRYIEWIKQLFSVDSLLFFDQDSRRSNRKRRLQF